MGFAKSEEQRDPAIIAVQDAGETPALRHPDPYFRLNFNQ